MREELTRLSDPLAPAKRRDELKPPGADSRKAALSEDEDLALRTARGRLLRLRLEGAMSSAGYRSATDEARKRVVAYQRRQVSGLLSARAKAMKAQGKTLTVEDLLPVQLRGRMLADLEPAA